jgi:small subunit ribosomal protein S1
MEEKATTLVTVKEAVKGGVVTYIDGIRAFIPASRLSLSYVEDLATFVGKEIPVRVIEAAREGKKLVLSSREALQERREAEKAERINNIEVGLVTEGTVASLQTYGAFVSLGEGIDGLVHISQITNTKRLKHPKEMLSVGDKVKVKVTQVKDGKISLSMKALEERPEVAPAPVREEKVVIPKAEKLSTSLGDLLKGIKLD